MKATGLYPCVRGDAAGSGVVSQAGGLLLIEAVRVSGLDTELSRMLAPPHSTPRVSLRPSTRRVRQRATDDVGLDP